MRCAPGSTRVAPVLDAEVIEHDQHVQHQREVAGIGAHVAMEAVHVRVVGGRAVDVHQSTVGVQHVGPAEVATDHLVERQPLDQLGQRVVFTEHLVRDAAHAGAQPVALADGVAAGDPGLEVVAQPGQQRRLENARLHGVAQALQVEQRVRDRHFALQ